MSWLKRLFGKPNTPAPAPATPAPAAPPAVQPAAASETSEADDRARAIEEIDAQVRTAVAASFRDEAEIIESTVEVLADDFDEELLRPLAVERTKHYLAEQVRIERNWPAVTDCDRLDRAFAALEQRGIVCRQNFTCCGTCGHAEIGDEMESVREDGTLVRGYAFYHMQDTERAVEGAGVYLAYGATEEGTPAAVRIGHEICDALRAEGLEVDWDGTLERRIGVSLDWKRRRGPRCARA